MIEKEDGDRTGSDARKSNLGVSWKSTLLSNTGLYRLIVQISYSGVTLVRLEHE